MSELIFEPMSVGGILDQAFRLYRQRFARFLAIVAIIQVPMYLLLMGCMVLMLVGVMRLQGGEGREFPIEFVAIMGVSYILYILVLLVGQQLSTAALFKGVSESYLGRDVSVGQAYRFVLPKALSLIGAALLVGLITLAGYVLCIVPGVIFSLWYALTAPSIIIENCGAIGGMARSKQLASGNLGRIFLVLLVMVLISWVFTIMFQIGGQYLTTFLLADEPLAAAVVQQLFQMIPAILIMPVTAAAIVLLYYDLRIRKEGFDLEMLAERLASAEAPGANQPGA